MKCLNLGCGLRFHSDWINIDWAPSSPHVQAYDLTKNIPFPDYTFDVVYHSHLLEHFPKQKAFGFIQECYRVLGAGGCIRIAVPDLEQIARVYLRALENALQGQTEWRHHYEWIMLELYDQAVRVDSGGAMSEYLKKEPIPNEAFVYERIGGEARRIIQAFRTKNQNPAEEVQHSRRDGFFACSRYLRQIVRARLLRALLDENDYRALEIARFRLRGELHQWMYDRYSLGELLGQVGFKDSKSVGPTESRIPGWTTYHLDADPDGTVYKPDSLYMEAVKP